MANPKAIISADGMGSEATEADYDGYINYVCERIDERCGFEVELESVRFGESGDRIVADSEAQRLVIREALIALWDEWCATGWNEWLERQGGEAAHA